MSGWTVASERAIGLKLQKVATTKNMNFRSPSLRGEHHRLSGTERKRKLDQPYRILSILAASTGRKSPVGLGINTRRTAAG